MMQIIDENGYFTMAMRTQLQGKPFKTEYLTISVLGSQSSGKSTLLNKLFGLEFQVLNAKVERKQTTKGIWLAVAGNVLVFDPEGSDSGSRWDSQNFERYVGVFAMAVCDIVLVNIWITDVGKFNAAQYELLKTAIQQQLKLYGRKFKKGLVFVIRDFDPQKENQEKIQSRIESDVRKLWNSFTNLTFNDLFTMKVVCLTDLTGRQEQTLNSVTELRALVGSLTQCRNPKVPIDAYDAYCAKIWNEITNQKDLNLPQCAVLVSKFRCDQIRQEIFELHANQIKSIDQHTKNEFRKRVEEIKREFGDKTAGYDDGVVGNSLKQLLTDYSAAVKASILNELNSFQLECYRDLSNEVIESINQGTAQAIVHFQRKYQDVFQAKLSDLDGVFKADELQGLLSNFLRALESHIASFKSHIWLQMKQDIIFELEGKVLKRFDTLFQEFQPNLLQQSLKYQEEVTWQFEQRIMATVRLLENQVEKTIVNALLQEIRGKLQAHLQLLFQNIVSHAENKYKNQFLYDLNGYRRRWSTYNDDEIQNLNQSILKSIYATLDSCKLNENILQQAKQRIMQVSEYELEEALRKRSSDSGSWVFLASMIGIVIGLIGLLFHGKELTLLLPLLAVAYIYFQFKNQIPRFLTIFGMG